MSAELRSLQSRLRLILALSAELQRAELPEQTLFDQLLSALVQLFDAEGASIALIDPLREELSFALQQGERRGEPFRLPLSQGIAGRVAREGTPLLTNSVQRHRDFYNKIDERRAQETRNMICSPIEAGGKRLGTLQVLNTNDEAGFSEEDLETLTAIGTLTAQALRRAESYQRLLRREAAGREALSDRYTLVWGENPKMNQALLTLRQAAPSGANLLLLGESGVGKEVAARAVHRWSERKDGPFIALNCAAIAPNLLESELFGHERGAFTGAHSRRKGKFELAAGGTLFLDEIGDLDLSLQSKLLRVLQERSLERVGGDEQIDLDVRLIAATHRSLEEQIKDGQFREDLFYRLNVIQVRLPPLRERREDIPLLTRHFVRQSCNTVGRPLLPINDALLDAFSRYHWPGNLRELSNLCERLVVLCIGDELSGDLLPAEFQKLRPASERENAVVHRSSEDEGVSLHFPAELPLPTLREARGLLQRVLSEEALRRSQGHQADAAKLLGVQSSNFSALLKRLGLRSGRRRLGGLQLGESEQESADE